jgi:transcriptional regulator with XRE-family HTH domain
MAPSPARTPETDPAAYLGQHLRRLRLMAGFTTQAALAVRLSVSNDYVSKAETGYLPPTEEVFLAWLDVCGASAEARDFLTGLWTVVRALSGGIPQFFAKYVTAEEKAAFLRLWGLLLIPGPLQARDYAHAMFLAGGLDKDAAAEQVGLRLKRQAILDGPDPAHVTALIYEPVLSRLVGTPEIMIGQLDHLLEMSRRRNVIIQVVPDTGYFRGLEGPFHIASGPEIPDTVDLVAVEDYVTDDPTVARKVVALFEEIRSYALNGRESQVRIQEALERWTQQK